MKQQQNQKKNNQSMSATYTTHPHPSIFNISQPTYLDFFGNGNNNVVTATTDNICLRSKFRINNTKRFGRRRRMDIKSCSSTCSGIAGSGTFIQSNRTTTEHGATKLARMVFAESTFLKPSSNLCIL
jgi:hypothetical protein